jgi:hypothetical protein
MTTQSFAGENAQLNVGTPIAQSAAPHRRHSGNLLAAIAAIWHAALEFEVPIGYEDETGFHRGQPPERHPPS